MKSKLLIMLGCTAVSLSLSTPSHAYMWLFGNQTQDCFKSSCQGCGGGSGPCGGRGGFGSSDDFGSCSSCVSSEEDEFNNKMKIFCNIGDNQFNPDDLDP